MDLREYILQRCEELSKRLKPASQEPLIVGLFRLLPPIGASFPEKKQRQWIEAMASILDLLYEIHN